MQKIGTSNYEYWVLNGIKKISIEQKFNPKKNPKASGFSIRISPNDEYEIRKIEVKTAQNKVITDIYAQKDAEYELKRQKYINGEITEQQFRG